MPSRPPSDIRRGLAASVWEGGFAQAYITWTTGYFLIAFGTHLGADPMQLGVLAALPVLAQAAQLGSAYLFETAVDRRRPVTVWTLLVARALWVVPAALAFAGRTGGSALALYFAVVFVSAALHMSGAHGWQSWMRDLVPFVVRGRYFGFRSAVCAVVALGVGIGGGSIAERLEASRPGLGFAAIFLAAAVAGIGAFVAIRVQHHPEPHRHPAPIPFLTLWREVWATPALRRILGYFGPWYFALGVSMAFWVDFMKGPLGMSEPRILLQQTLGGIIGIGTAIFWGRFIDRRGNRFVLLVCAASIALIPFVWLFARPDFLLPVWIDAVLVGIFWTGFLLTFLNIPLAAAPRRGSALFLGLFGALTGVCMGVSSILGGFVARAIGAGTHEVLGLPLSMQQVMFLIGGVLRVAAFPLALRIRDSGRTPRRLIAS
jgi:hypothetical protein